MAADKRAIDLGKIKRYIRNRTAEFYLETLNSQEQEEFKAILGYLNNVRRTKDLTPQYDEKEVDRIKSLLTNFSPTSEQYSHIQTINRQKRKENVKVIKVRKKRAAAPSAGKAITAYEKISTAFRDMKTLLEETGKELNARELEFIRKNTLAQMNHIENLLQDRVRFEIDQAEKQADEIKAKIDRLNNKFRL